jgi:ribosomal protein S18 acetylase RimI-like enzyme
MKGCVNLQNNERGVYLGMFSVEPELQGAGIGKQLLMAADDHARKIGASHIYMYVISLRQELINWYKRYGFEETGEQFPFAEDGLTGTHLQPLEFIVLEKVLD